MIDNTTRSTTSGSSATRQSPAPPDRDRAVPRGAADGGQHRRRDDAHDDRTFTTPGTLTYVCHLPGHEAYGMTGTLIVTAD